MSIYLFVTIKHLVSQIRISRVAIKNQAIGYKVGLHSVQTDLVAIICLPAIFNDDVGMGFKDGEFKSFSYNFIMLLAY